MLRRWTLAVASISTIWIAAPCAAQHRTGVSLAERFGLTDREPEQLPAADQRPAEGPRAADMMYDPAVQPAAVRSPRDAAQNQQTTRRTGGGSFFSRLKLPNILPGGGSQSQQEELADAPLPYDPAELEGPSTPTAQPARQATAPTGRTAVRRTAPLGATMQQPATGATLRAPTAGQQGATGPQVIYNRTTNSAAPRTAPTTTTSQPMAQPTATPRVARSSPRLDNRHNELADALTGLRDNPPEPDDVAVEVTTEPVAEEPAEVAPPAAAAGEAAPSYLDGETSSDDEQAEEVADAEPIADVAPPAVGGPLDVADALLGSDIAPTPTARATTAAPRSAASGPRAAAVAPPTKQLAVPPSPPPVRQTPIAAPTVQNVIENEAAAVPQVGGRYASTPITEDTSEALGSVPAAPAPLEYDSTPIAPAEEVRRPASQPMTESRTSSSPSVGSTTTPKPRPTTPQMPGIGNYRRPTDVLATCKPPLIISSVAGPPRIIVGRVSEYRVHLENRGEESARELVATVAVPAWAKVEDAQATNGEVSHPAPAADGEPQQIKWELYELGAGASQTLTLKLVPQSGRSLLLAVACDQAPPSAEATVEVQEPKLEMEITGPGEVVFGKSQRYSLTLSNPGTGNADDVMIELVPPGGDPKAPVRHKVGQLAAGSTKTIELELTAREAGDLKMQAAATAAGDLRIETLKTVLCRRARLNVDWRGPESNYAGAVATYYIRVKNPGTAPADKVLVELNLPTGAELVDASAGHSWDAERRTVSWQPGALAATEERFMQVRCKLSKPGVNQLELVARNAAGDLSDVRSVPVTVEALADLKLQVSDPQGVLPVGQTAQYEIRVQNRGLTAAHGINVVAMFSAGIEPMHVEGGQHEIRDGRVAFRTIDALPAGAEVVLRIHAKASEPGTHVFRTEVVCDDLETKLAAEETTRYFVEEERWADASAAYSDGEATTR